MLALALVLLLALAATARAAIPLQNPKGDPLDTTQANAATRFNFHIEFGGSEHIKDLTQQLPAGIRADPFHPTCPPATWMADRCPESSQVGTSAVDVRVLGLLPQTVRGRIYYLDPEGGGLPGLGIVLDSPTGKQFQRGETRINNELGVVESTIRNFPQSAGGVPIRIDAVDVVLDSTFINNPATCDRVVTRFLATSYEDPGTTSSAEAPFTPTGCDPPSPPLCDKRRSTRVGTSGRDVIKGTPRRDVVTGRGGNDLIRGLGGNDLICGGAGRDTLIGGAGRDTLLGGAAADRLKGGAGRDTLRGGAGGDRLRGGAGLDDEVQ